MVQDAFETETLARLYLDQGHPEKALPIFKRLHQQDPSSSSISQGLAHCEELLANRSGGGQLSHEKRLAILKRLLAMLRGELPAEPRRHPVAAAAAPQPPTLSLRERRLAVLQKLMKRLTAREA
jgi:hypothetical protein